MQAEPQEQHQWLLQLVGEWSYEAEVVMAPDVPADKFLGRETVRPLGSLWVIGEGEILGEGQAPGGGSGHSVLTIGYDSAKGRFVGTFVSSMMTQLWTYEGELDESRTVLKLNAEGPNFSGDGIATYQDIMELESSGHRITTSQVLGEDGKWQRFMTARYRRIQSP